MPITIKGIRIESMSWERKEDSHKLSGSYALISSTDKVLAKQSIGPYHGSMDIQPSASTLKAFDTFMEAYKADVEAATGLGAE